ncbi:MAG TPA: S-methyl-5'-thioadenosine phosphorylase [Anaerolineales bacterium]|nr:S-methyl-5'-thioadenosine phosphorylase [Anaerolineales bacterium]
MTRKPVFAVIGGSGLYGMPDLEDVETHQVDTPFGLPSSPIIIGSLAGRRVAFLARHGEGHILSPSEINYRANIYALKAIGVERIVSVSACGSLRDDYEPGHIVIPDQLFDFTKDRKRSFFTDGLVAHVPVADPFCRDLSAIVVEATRTTGKRVHSGGTFITIEGPRFSTRGESHTFRSWGMSIIGMTTSPEAFLAKEAELCYAVMAHVTDYDVWHAGEEAVTADLVFKTVVANLEAAQDALRNLAANFPTERDCDCDSTLSTSLSTHPDKISPETRKRLGLLVDKYFTEN